MSAMIDIARFGLRPLWQGSEHARPSAIATAAANRDLTAVVVFSAIGLFLSLSFVLLFPGGLSFIAAMP
jgi:hypothetical protein